MLGAIIQVIVNSPIYPHWLEHRKMRQGDAVILKNIKGKILEVGSGDGTKKQNLTAHYPKITSYTATDYTTWDNEFENFGEVSKKYGRIGEIFMSRQARLKLDEVCSATDLPYKNNSYDVHLSFEVLEHLDDPFAYFSEASRVVKPGGQIIFSIPFLYREHTLDYFRYTTGFFELVAKNNNLKIVQIYTNTGVGTTTATLFNQWLVRLILESWTIFKPFLLVLSPVFFLVNNIVGWFIDLKPDKRFATRYHIVFKKPNK